MSFVAPLGITWRIFTVWRGPPANRNALAAELTSAHNRKLHFDLYGPATAGIDLDGRSPETATIAELSQDLVFRRFRPFDGGYDTYFRGPIGHSEDSLDGTNHSTNVQAADYRALLGRTIAPAYVATAQLQENIVGMLVNPSLWNQAYPANQGLNYEGALNPDGSGLVGNTGTTRTITYTGTEQVGAEIDKLATMQGGFDWGAEPWPSGWGTFDPNVATGTVRLYYPQRGVSQPFVAEYGVNVASVKRTVDSTTFANWVQYTGQSGTAAQVAAGDVMTNPQSHSEGLWQETKADANTASTALLLAEAQHDLAFDSVLTPTYQLTLSPGAWHSQSDCWLGDTIRVRVQSGRLAVDINVRIMQVDITLDDAGNETIALTVARPPRTLAQVLGAQNQNLYQLNRR